ncbi:FtsB family cell division protein [Streptomyces barringtoniae]|uniref:FtsB family cell division protein n=1 Tax=Streptomyces barringtoniae TaxID=2892029 RepID=UPI001E309612|nr:septum formation initiator family protein [Streptomyces barringtoniae]MCC5478215.1 septum formation initiator family protein [Streptomyces barringtoniae]
MSRTPVLRGRAARLARLFPAGRARAARTPFVLLVVLLLGGGLIGLLVLNSALSEGSFKLADLQKQTKNLTDEEQALQRDIDAYSAPDALQRRARELGMVPGGDPAFLGSDGKIKGVPGAAGPESAALTDPVAPESLTPATAPSTALAAPTTVAPATPTVPAPTAPATPAPATPSPAAPPQGQPQSAAVASDPAAAIPPPPSISQPTPTPTPGR